MRYEMYWSMRGFLVLICLLVVFPTKAGAATSVLSERYAVIFDLSGTFVKDRGNIQKTVDKLRQLADTIEKTRKEDEAALKKETHGRQRSLRVFSRRESYFTIIVLGSHPKAIWSGSGDKFLQLCGEGAISNLLHEVVRKARRTGETRCTDIRGAMDLAVRRMRAKDPRRELVIRAGIIMFSDLLDDPPGRTGVCTNHGNSAPPEGVFWQELADLVDANSDRSNDPPAFYPQVSFIALGVMENSNRDIDPVTLWSEKLHSLENPDAPFLLEFHSFDDAVNYVIPPPARVTLQAMNNYLMNFDPLEGTRIVATSSTNGKHHSGAKKTLFALIAAFAVGVFFIVFIVVALIVLIILFRRKRSTRQINRSGGTRNG